MSGPPVGLLTTESPNRRQRCERGERRNLLTATLEILMAHDNSAVNLTDSLEDRISTAVASEGEERVATRAFNLLEGGYEGEEFLLIVGGSHAEGILAGAPPLYWPELWGARALLQVWTPAAEQPVVSGLSNQAWRVREMCSRVTAARNLAASSELIGLLRDGHARVRAAAVRALGAIGDETAADSIEASFRDPDKDVRRAAQQALTALRERL
jgi:hypothetical protein